MRTLTGCYEMQTRPYTERSKRDEGARIRKPRRLKASVHLKAVFTASHQRCGSRRLVTAMTDQGIEIGRYEVLV
jgi:hypothetical protein